MFFRYTILYVEDVAQSLEFYERAFGLQRGFLHEGCDYGELLTGDTKLAFSSRTLMQQLGKSPKKAETAEPTFELAFETQDVSASYAKAIAAGAKPIQEVREENWGQTTSYVGDPDGYLVEICSPVQVPNPG